jgi:hypothetical protein
VLVHSCFFLPTSTAMLIAEGTFDPTQNVLTLVGKTDDPVTGEHDKITMYIYRMASKDTFILEIHDLSLPQGRTKAIEIEYTRTQ